MERIEYDPEIDPSIRQAQEEAERERELSARIRLEIERYAHEAEKKEEKKESEEEESDPDPDPEKNREEEDLDAKQQRRLQREEKRHLKAKKRAKRTDDGRRAFQSIFTGNILSSEWVRNMFPYLIGFAVLLMLYIANIFHLQRLHRNQQRLEIEIHELSIEAVDYSAQKAQQTQRSAIVNQLEQKNIPLKEFPNPVKTIEGK